MQCATFWQATQLFLLCCTGSVAVGLAVYGGNILVPNQVHFQFVASGVFCSAFVVSVMFLRKLHTIVVVGVAFVSMQLFVGLDSLAGQGESYIRNAAYMACLYIVASVGIASSRWYPRLVFGKFIIWSAISAAVHLVALYVLALVRYQTVSVNPERIQSAAEVGALVGAGIGVGFEVWELVRRRCSGTEENAA